MEFMVEIEIWKLKLSFETLATGTVAKSWLGQEKRGIVTERNNCGNLAIDVQPLFGLVLSWEGCAILVYYLAIKCLVIALVMKSDSQEA